MHFTKLFAGAALAASVLAQVPGVVNDFPISQRDVIKGRAACSRNNLLRALVRFQGNGTEQFCQSYLGVGSGGTATVTLPGGTVTVGATITETPEVVTEVVTEIGTVTALARRQAAISVPAGISQYANDTRLSSGCACLLYSTSVVPSGLGSVVTVTGPAGVTATSTATVTADGTTTTATTFETTTVPKPSDTTASPTSSDEPTSEPTDTTPTPTSSDEPTPTAPCIVNSTPLPGCVFGSAIISATLITEKSECEALCEADLLCLAYQVGVDGDGAIAYCETLNVLGVLAYDSVGSTSDSSSAYCSQFTIYDYRCATSPAPARFRRYRL